MAALAIPLIANLVPIAIPLLVRLVDKLFGSKTGAVKFQSVIAAIMAILQGMVTTGQLTQAQMPAQAAIQAQVQAVVDELNAKGELQGMGTVVVSASPGFTLSADQRLLLSTAQALLAMAGVKA